MVETLLCWSHKLGLKLKWVSWVGVVGGLEQKCEGKRSEHYCGEVSVKV